MLATSSVFKFSHTCVSPLGFLMSMDVFKMLKFLPPGPIFCSLGPVVPVPDRNDGNRGVNVGGVGGSN